MNRTRELEDFITRMVPMPVAITADATRLRGTPTPPALTAVEDQALALAAESLIRHGLDPGDPDDRLACWAVLAAVSHLATHLERMRPGDTPTRYVNVAVGGLHVLLAGREQP